MAGWESSEQNGEWMAGGSSMVSHKLVGRLFLEWHVANGEEGCWEGGAGLTERLEGVTGVW